MKRVCENFRMVTPDEAGSVRGSLSGDPTSLFPTSDYRNPDENCRDVHMPMKMFIVDGIFR